MISYCWDIWSKTNFNLDLYGVFGTRPKVNDNQSAQAYMNKLLITRYIQGYFTIEKVVCTS